MYAIGSHMDKIQSTLNSWSTFPIVILAIPEWTPMKTKVMLLHSPRTQAPSTLRIFVDGHPLQQVTSFKLL